MRQDGVPGMEVYGDMEGRGVALTPLSMTQCAGWVTGDQRWPCAHLHHARMWSPNLMSKVAHAQREPHLLQRAHVRLRGLRQLVGGRPSCRRRLQRPCACCPAAPPAAPARGDVGAVECDLRRCRAQVRLVDEPGVRQHREAKAGAAGQRRHLRRRRTGRVWTGLVRGVCSD